MDTANLQLYSAGMNTSSSQSHFDDLRRRYRETDWVSELQRLWAIFNHWFAAEYSTVNYDRAQIELLKLDPRLSVFVYGIIEATPYFDAPHRITDGFGGAYPRFATDNVLSSFFRDVRKSPRLEPAINYPWRSSNAQKPPHLTTTIVLSREEFRECYLKFNAVSASSEFIPHRATLHQLLGVAGVASTGCCFWRCDPVPIQGVPLAFANAFFAASTTIPTFHEFATATPDQTTLEVDLVETLYQARNAAMHGSLDFLIPGDNAAARGACDFLDALLQDIRDNW
ncbi:MAG: hypothetical protein GY822_30330 [Deltaproteobacteria bacterium]|nr:hypothetical protein [Deltaproteobacteria bacterium]